MKKIFFAVSVLCAFTGRAQFCFTLYAQYPNLNPNNNMFGMCKGDFDSDGILDLAITNTTSDNITIFKGFGGGNFGVSGSWNCGTQPHQIICADFNNDGAPDLATANFGASNFSVLLNSGTGTFPAMSNVPSGPNVKSITAADFNGDGKKDIAVVNSGNGSHSVFLGNGTGGFILTQNTNTGGQPYGICSADFDKDGDQDLVTVNNMNGQALYMAGTGGGTFAPPANISIGLNAPYELIAEDLNADGNMDIAVADGGSNAIEIAFGTGTGTFSGGPGLSPVAGARMVAAGDLNNDGKVDLAGPAFNGGTINLFQGFGGGFGPGFQIGNGGNPRTVVIGDFNADGLNDIAMANNGSNALSIYLNTQPNVSITGATSYCAGGSTTLTASGATTYTWSTSVTTSTVSLNPVSTTTYYVAGGDITCSLKDTLFFSVTVNPLPVLTATANPSNICPGTQMTLTGGGASTYTWSSGVTNGVPFSSPVVATTYTLTATDNNGCVGTNTFAVSPAITNAPNICTVTVDSLSLNNVIVWDKTLYPNADSFYVYRDTANNNYAQLVALPYAALSQFVDTARTLASVNGDPNISTYHYKIAYRDTCGNMSPKSPFHSSIFQYNVGSIFFWNAYEIEGQPTPVPGLSSYNLKRDNVGATGNYVTAASAPASAGSVSDPQYGTWQAQADWRVETVWNITCVATQRLDNNGTLGSIVRSKSNITNNRITGVKTLDKIVSLYPNPTNSSLVIDFGAMVSGKISIKVYSALGEEVYAADLTSIQYKHIVDLSNNTKGMYLVQIITDAGVVTRKVLKN